MDASQFQNSLKQKTELLRQYVRDDYPRIAAAKIIRFVDGNFRAQGWQGRVFMPWRKNRAGTTILVRKGRLRRGTRSETPPYTVRVYNATPYARFHNRGFQGTVTVKAHTRNKYKAVHVGTGRFTKSGAERIRTVHQLTGTTNVRSHIRHVNNPKRQFMPETADDSPVLYNALKREFIKGIKAIFK